MSEIFTDAAVLTALGGRLAQLRVDSGLTQAELARQAGVGRSTVERLESGKSTQLSRFIRILRVLGLLDEFLDLAPEPGLSPMDLLRLKRGRRRRARRSGNKPASDDEAWHWADEQ
jgi:transcriptional regulator with XRE-family HTH domain